MTSARPQWILVVDDEEDVREALAAALTSSGYEVRTAADGDAALTMIEAASAPPALVLLDLLLPGATGREVLRSLPDRATIPVVVLTGVDVAVTDLVEKLGVVQVLRKPVAVSDLLEVVRRTTSRT